MENALYVVNARIELLAIIDKVMRNAKSVKTKSVTFQRTPQRVEKKDIKKFFGESDE